MLGGPFDPQGAEAAGQGRAGGKIGSEEERDRAETDDDQDDEDAVGPDEVAAEGIQQAKLSAPVEHFVFAN